MVPSKYSDALWVSNLQSDEEGNRLDRVITSIDIVACVHGVSMQNLSDGLALTHE